MALPRRRQGPLKTSNAIALKQGALAGLGIILQREWIVGREILDGSLVDLFPDYDVTASHFDNAIWRLYPSRAYLQVKSKPRRLPVGCLPRWAAVGPS